MKSQIIRLAQRWGAAVELMRLIPSGEAPDGVEDYNTESDFSYGRRDCARADDGGVPPEGAPTDDEREDGREHREGRHQHASEHDVLCRMRGIRLGQRRVRTEQPPAVGGEVKRRPAVIVPDMNIGPFSQQIFHYFGVADPIAINGEQFWRNGKYDASALENVYVLDHDQAKKRVDAMSSGFFYNIEYTEKDVLQDPNAERHALMDRARLSRLSPPTP